MHLIRNNQTMKHIYQDTQALSNISAFHSDKHIHIIYKVGDGEGIPRQHR